MSGLPSSGRAVWCLLAFGIAVTLSYFSKSNFYKMVWWAVKVAGTLVGGNHGRDVCVFEQAGVLGAGNWFL